MGKVGYFIKDEDGYIKYKHFKDVLTLDDDIWGNRLTYLFQNKEYILCGFDHLAAESPEEYSMSRGEEEWVSLGGIALDSKPILPNIYPYDMLTFVWDDKHEYMYPTEIEHICFYDLYTTDIYHIDLNSLESYSKNNPHILLFKKFIRLKV